MQKNDDFLLDSLQLLCTKLRALLVKNENGRSFCKYVKYVCVFLERRASQPLSCIKKVLMIIHRKSFARRRIARELAAISSKSSRASGDSWISIASYWNRSDARKMYTDFLVIRTFMLSVSDLFNNQLLQGECNFYCIARYVGFMCTITCR